MVIGMDANKDHNNEHDSLYLKFEQLDRLIAHALDPDTYNGERNTYFSKYNLVEIKKLVAVIRAQVLK